MNTSTNSVAYEAARELVRSEVGSGWSFGTFCLDDRKIVENDQMWVFDVGPWEYLVRRDPRYRMAGGVPVVYKRTGRLGWLPSSTVAMDASLTVRPNPDPTLIVKDG